MPKLIHQCNDCGYKGTDGYWVGTAQFDSKHNIKVEFNGRVELDDEDHWPLDDLITRLEKKFNTELVLVEGEANCPICKSKNYYPKLERRDSYDNACERNGTIL